MRTFSMNEIRRAYGRAYGDWESVRYELQRIFERRNKRKGTSRTRRKKK